MERNGVLQNRWNGPIKREHRSEKRLAWSREKNQTHQERLSQHDTLAAELETTSIRHAESIELNKSLQDKIKALRSHQDISSKQEIKDLQKQIETEKEKRRALKIERTGIKKTMQGLKDSGLNGSRINGRRPASSTPIPTVDNPAGQSDIEASLPNINESPNLETPSMFIFFGSQYLKFNFRYLIKVSDSLLNNTMEDLAEASLTSMNAATFFEQVYNPTILENEPQAFPHSTTGFSGAS
jgi:hypothetical protein